MDTLSEVLKTVQLNGAVYLSAEFSAPWCLVSEPDSELCAAFLPRSERVVSFHLVIEGQCLARLAVAGSPVLRLVAGDILVAPQGDSHLLGSTLDLQPVRAAPLLVEQVVARPGEIMRVGYGGGGARVRLVCGFLTCAGLLGNPLIASLPRLFSVRVLDGPESAWLTTALQFAAAEAAAPGAGSATVLAKLSELLFIHAVRRYVDGLSVGQKGWLAGVHDRYVGRAILKLHADPAYPWTVEELARQVGLSRSALAQRFTALLGQPPMQYLAQWRLHAAARELREGSKTLAQIAGAAGYESEPAFSRAFKRTFGLPPASWRTSQSQANALGQGR